MRQSLDVVDAAVGQDDVALGNLLRSFLLASAIGFALILEFYAWSNPKVGGFGVSVAKKGQLHRVRENSYQNNARAPLTCQCSGRHRVLEKI